MFKGRGNWGTLRIPREDWGTFGEPRKWKKTTSLARDSKGNFGRLTLMSFGTTNLLSNLRHKNLLPFLNP